MTARITAMAAARCLASLALATVFSASSKPALACADGYHCAVVRETSDGFTALRAAPTASSSLLQKLRPYEIVVISVDSCDPSPAWTPVASVPRFDGYFDETRSGLTAGFVKSSLLVYTDCP